MQADNNPGAQRAVAEDFRTAVDAEAFRQVAEMNLRGLRVLRDALAEGRVPDIAAVAALRERWLDLDDAALRRVADAPFLLFELSVDAALAARRAPVLAVGDDPRRAASWCARAPGRAFARLMCHFSWQTVRTAPAAAVLLLGISPSGCGALRGLGLQQLDAFTEIAGDWLTLRWADDVRLWKARLAAAAADDPDRLWQQTLVGLQRLAVLARPSAAAVAASRPSSPPR